MYLYDCVVNYCLNKQISRCTTRPNKLLLKTNNFILKWKARSMEPVNTICIENMLILLVDRKEKFCGIFHLGVAVFCVSFVHILVSLCYLLSALMPLMSKDDASIFHLGKR